MMNSRSMFGRWMRRPALAAGLILALTTLSLTPGCMRVNVMPKAQKDLTVGMSEPRPVDKLNVPKEYAAHEYRIGPQDILRIDVRKDPTISQQPGYVVTDEGNVVLPYIGSVNVLDLTVKEAEQKMNTMLAEYIRQPDVKIGVLQYRSKFIYVVGQVARPGRIYMRADRLTLQEAIFQAGLPMPDAAPNRTKIITPAETQPIVRQVDATNLIYKGKMAENMVLRPNDIVYVPAKQSSNLTVAIFDVIRPFYAVTDFLYRISLANYANNNNNNNNNNSNNNTGNNNNPVIVPVPNSGGAFGF